MPKTSNGKPSRRSARHRKRAAPAPGTMHAFFRPAPPTAPEPRVLSRAPGSSRPRVAQLDPSDSDEIESIHSSDSSRQPSPMQEHVDVQRKQPSVRPVLSVATGVLACEIAPSPSRLPPLCSKCGAAAEAPQGTSEDTRRSPVESGTDSLGGKAGDASAAEGKKYSFRSRLSRRKMLAERARSRAQPPVADSRPPIKVKIVLPKQKPAPEVVDLVSSPKRGLQRPSDGQASPKRRRTEASNDLVVIDADNAIPVTAKASSAEAGEAPAKLHSFFKTTQKAVASKKSEGGTRKTCLVAAHSWMSPWATVHVNAPPLSNEVSKFHPAPVLDLKTTPTWPHLEKLYCGHSQIDTNFEPSSYAIGHTEAGRVSAWAELYKDCESIDRVNASAVATLVDWLGAWYKGGGSVSASCSSDVSSFNTETGMPRIETERTALLLGPSGCGKSTVVKIAARHLGLSILEINQSVCRRGQKVKDIVGEALKTHRVTSNVQNSTFGKQGPPFLTDCGDSDGRSPRTLILFEEVDELHDDERGFWATLRELVSADNCKRPVVCTANKFSVAMKTLFGMPPPPEEDKQTSLILSNDVPEECVNPWPYQLIQLKMRSQGQVREVLRTVSARENLGENKRLRMYHSHAARFGDIRHAVNTLQFWSNPSAVSPLPANVFNVHTASELLCSSPSSTESVRSLQLLSTEHIDCDQKFSVLQSVYRAATNTAFAATVSDETFQAESISNIADALDSFCLADQLPAAAGRNNVDMDFTSTEDLQIEEEGFSGIDGAIEVSSCLNSLALSSLGNSLSFLDGEKIAEIAVKDFAVTDAPWYPHLGDTASLCRRTTVTESVPALRTMLLAAKKVRRQRASSDGNDAPAVSSRRRQTRSQRKADHVLSFNLGEEATSLLEQNCLKFEFS